MFDVQTILAMAPPPGGPGQEQQSPLYFPMMMILLFAVMYFLMIRPQKQKEKERQLTLQKIKSGDRVLFGGGIIGIVTNVKDKTLVVRAADKVKLEVLRSAVSQILEKDELPSDVDQDASK